MGFLNPNNSVGRELVGLIPAGGKASRVAPLPCSKELFPIGFYSLGQGHDLRPKTVCHYLLEKMRVAGTRKAYIVLRQGKWDIPAYFKDGDQFGIHLAYLMMGLPYGVPYTLDQGYFFVKDAIVLFGFPDILFEPEDAFVRLLARQAQSDADVVLGLFPVHLPEKWHMVEADGSGRVRSIVINPVGKTHLEYTWIIAVWTPVFSHFMHEYVEKVRKGSKPMDGDRLSKEPHELTLSEVIQQGIDSGLRVEAVTFPNRPCLDIGTPEDLVKAVNGSVSQAI